jgi:hypothetical protein
MAGVMIDGYAIYDCGAALEMGEGVFCDEEHGKDVCIECILQLFRRQFLDGRLFELGSSMVDEDLKVSESFLCFLHNLFTVLPLTLQG